MYLYIIRHGETYGNINGDGFTETDLTDNGLNQAFLLGERFKDERIDAIYTSNLIRAVKTGKKKGNEDRIRACEEFFHVSPTLGRLLEKRGE